MNVIGSQQKVYGFNINFQKEEHDIQLWHNSVGHKIRRKK